MAIPLMADFKEFLRSLNSNHVEYLLIGGYAVAVHGFIRTTNDLDVWIRISPENALRAREALHQFGFAAATLDLFLAPNKVIRMGVQPLRIEMLTSISGVEFDSCYLERTMIEIDGITIPVIGLTHLRENKRASGRPKDLADLDNLPS